ETHGAAVRGELDRVCDEVVDDPEELWPIGEHRLRRLRLDEKRDVLCASCRAGRLRSLVQDPAEIDRPAVELEWMRVGAREEEELLDEGGEPLGVSLDDLEVGLAGGRKRAFGRVEGHFEIAAERRE